MSRVLSKIALPICKVDSRPNDIVISKGKDFKDHDGICFHNGKEVHVHFQAVQVKSSFTKVNMHV